MTHEEQYRARGRAAIALAAAAARLRDADDALVNFGRLARAHGDDIRRAPSDDEVERALDLTQGVADAYAEMRATEQRYFQLGGARTSDGDGFVRVDVDHPPGFRGGSGPEERL